MARKPFAALLALAVAFPALAAGPVVTAAKDAIKKAYAKGADLRTFDLSALRDQTDSRTHDIEGALELLALFEQAKYVQAGREPGDARETYVAFVRSVARRLGTRSDRAVALYGDRVRRRLITAPKEEIEIRRSIAEDVRRNPDIPAATRKRIARNLDVTSRALLRGMAGDGGFVIGVGMADIGTAVGGGEAISPVVERPEMNAGRPETNWSKLPPRVPPVALVINPVPASPPAVTSSAFSWSSLAAHLDWDRGKRVAKEVFTGTLNYVKDMGKMCYKFVKQALIGAGIINAPNPESTGLVGLRPGAAKMFSEDVQKRPEILHKMGYRRVDLAHIGDDPSTIPDGSILAYAAGCSFADATNGHAELTLSESTYAELRAQNPRLQHVAAAPNEVRACHFSCMKRSMPFLRTYGKQGCLKMYVPVKPA